MSPIGLESNVDMQAESDMYTILRSKEIEKDPGRIRAAKQHAQDQANRMASIANSIELPDAKPFNGSVKGSKMGEKHD